MMVSLMTVTGVQGIPARGHTNTQARPGVAISRYVTVGHGSGLYVKPPVDEMRLRSSVPGAVVWGSTKGSTGSPHVVTSTTAVSPPSTLPAC